MLLRRNVTKSRNQKPAVQSNSQSATNHADRYEYEKTYPADAPNEGMAPNARVWRVFLDEAAADLDMVEHTRDTVDVILVFVSRFCASQLTLLTIL